MDYSRSAHRVDDGRSRLRRASMREVADLAGVATSSVSRVLSNHPDVSAQMRERVLVAVERLGYTPDLLAQSLRRQETLTVGFQVADISNPLFAEIALATERRLRESGYSLLLTNSETNPAFDAPQITLLEQRRVDGIILSLASETNERTLAVLGRLRIPLIVLDRDVPIDVSRVLSDHYRGMTDAIDHLLDLGHRRIALISGQTMRPVKERRRALEEAFARRNLPPTYVLIDASFSVEEGAKATYALLDSDDAPTAIVAGGNQIMLGALTACRYRGVRLGEELSFIGCDEIAAASLHHPPISVVSRDTAAIGVAAAELVLEELADTTGPRDVTLPTHFIRRDSCGRVRSLPPAWRRN